MKCKLFSAVVFCVVDIKSVSNTTRFLFDSHWLQKYFKFETEEKLKMMISTHNRNFLKIWIFSKMKRYYHHFCYKLGFILNLLFETDFSCHLGLTYKSRGHVIFLVLLEAILSLIEVMVKHFLSFSCDFVWYLLAWPHLWMSRTKISSIFGKFEVINKNLIIKVWPPI